ncbi:MAG: phosphotransferase [Alphaproteobacteria bacterium]|nr:phosphotransferase [Alphaproteobacteria bacterium]
MDQTIQTTGGILHIEDVQNIINYICDVFNCVPAAITELKPLQKGLTNSVLSFCYNGGKYVFRYPGLGSEVLVDRGRESIVQKQIEDAGVDTSLIAMSVRYGWRISRFVQNRPFNYHDVNDMVRGIIQLRKLHSVKPKVRWEFDLKEKWEFIKTQIPEERYGDNFTEFSGFSEIKERVYKLYELAKTDGIRKCLTHGDCRDENFLINDQEVHLIDWEYAGYGDPGFDIGSYVCGGNHSEEEVDRILFTYFGRKLSHKERRHFYAYIAITGFFYMHWTMFKESQGQIVGYLKPLWYYFAKEYSIKALQLYNE